MNNFIHAIDGFKTQQVYYTDTDSLFISGEALKKLDQAGYCGKKLGQGKNDLNKEIMVNCQSIKKYGIKKIKPLCDCENCEHNFVYVPDLEIVWYVSCGPKQKLVECKDKNSSYTTTKYTLKGCPLVIKQGVSLTDKFGFEEMYAIQKWQQQLQNGETPTNEITIIHYERKLKKQLVDGISQIDISKQITGDKFLDRVTITDDFTYIPKTN